MIVTILHSTNGQVQLALIVPDDISVLRGTLKKTSISGEIRTSHEPNG
ncbi:MULTISPECIES: hypothetical protein [unclassified Pseudomonas]